MADGRPFKYVKGHYKPQKAHLQPPKECVFAIWKKSPQGFSEMNSSAPKMKYG